MPMTTTQDAQAYELRNSGLTQRAIAERLGLTRPQVMHGITRHAARHGLPDPQQRQSLTGARTYARRAGLPFSDAEATVVANAAAAATISSIIPTRTFGVEIEFRRPNMSLQPETIAQALRDAGLDCQAESYNHSTRPHWKLIHDASSDRELVSPILSGAEGLAQVKTAMRVLRGLGCKVTRSEGMHVHVYVGDTTAVKVAEVFGFYASRQQSVFDRLNASCRRGRQQFCNGITSSDAARTMEYARRGSISAVNGRYVTVNLASFARYGTVEYRQHAGTLNGTKATAWIELMLAVTEYVIGHGDQAATTLEGTLGALVGAGLLGRRTADRLASKARTYGFTVETLTGVEAPAPAPETAVAMTGCDCPVCTVARERAARGEVVLNTIGA